MQRFLKDKAFQLVEVRSTQASDRVPTWCRLQRTSVSEDVVEEILKRHKR